MNKVKHLAFGITGALLVTAGLISCNSDEVIANEEATSTELQAKGGAYSSMEMQDYYIGGIEEGWYNEEKEDCSATDTYGCASFDDTDDDSTVDMLSNLKFDISNARIIFEENRELANQLFEPIVVEGVITEFFTLEHSYNPTTEIDYFKIKRTSDNVFVGVRKVKL